MKTRFTRWRLRSPLCAALDVVAALAGAGLFVVAAVDSVASWPSDKMLLTDPQLSRIAGIVLPPAWLWMIASTVMIYPSEIQFRQTATSGHHAIVPHDQRSRRTTPATRRHKIKLG